MINSILARLSQSMKQKLVTYYFGDSKEVRTTWLLHLVGTIHSCTYHWTKRFKLAATPYYAPSLAVRVNLNKKW